MPLRRKDAPWVWAFLCTVLFSTLALHSFPHRAPVSFHVRTCSVNHYSASCSSWLCNVCPHASLTAHYSNPAPNRIIHFLGSALRALMAGMSKFYSSRSPVRCGGGICLGYRWHLRQKEIKFKDIHQLGVWTWRVSNHGPLQCCSFLKPLLQIPSGTWWMQNAYLVMIWESFIQVICLILLRISVAEERILQTLFSRLVFNCINWFSFWFPL